MRGFIAALTGGKRVNGKALLILAGGLIGLGLGVHFVHGFQVRRNAGGLLEQADRLERGEDLHPLERAALGQLRAALGQP